MRGHVCLSILALLCTAAALATESVYTDLTDEACPVVWKDEESGSTRQLCPGIDGYKIAILGDDARVSLNIISPDGKEHPLNLWEVISGAFTDHGNKAEWRVLKEGQKSIPQALIVRVKAFEFPENPDKFTSYLSVSKITRDQICVTDKIKPSSKQNEKARLAADAATQKPCLESGGN